MCLTRSLTCTNAGLAIIRAIRAAQTSAALRACLQAREEALERAAAAQAETTEAMFGKRRGVEEEQSKV